MKLYDSLHNYGRIIVEVVTDEDVKDISLAIKYNDHGDEFLYIRTYSGEEYKYGYWLNRPGGEYVSFLKKPTLYKRVDKRCGFSNDVFCTLHDDDHGIRTWMGIGAAGKFDNAQWRFDYVMWRVKDLIETEGNLEKVESITWDSRINGFDGVAGKRAANNYLYGDRVTEVLYRGRAFDVKKLNYSVANTDEWGCNTYMLNTKQLV